MMRRNVMIGVAAASANLLICSPLDADEAATKPPGVSIVSQTLDSLTLTATDARGQSLELHLTRPTPDAPWQAPASVSHLPGIYFGNPEPTFARTSTLRALGISPRQAVQTLTESIANRPADDVTIVRVYSDEMVIALWQQQAITELWYVGAMVDGFDTAPGSPDACRQALDHCCRAAPIQPQPTSPPLAYPRPSINHCMAAISACGAAAKAEACPCLYSTCLFCMDGSAPPVCATIPGLEDLSAEACATHTSQCNPGPRNPNLDAKVLALLREILNRVQVIIDAEHAKRKAGEAPTDAPLEAPTLPPPAP